MNDPINPSTNNSPQNSDVQRFVEIGDYITDQSTSLDNISWRGIMVITEVFSLAGGATLTPVIGTFNPVSGDLVTLAQGAAIAAAGTSILTLYPGIAEVANEKVSQVLPRLVVVAWAHSAPGNIINFGAGGYLVL